MLRFAFDVRSNASRRKGPTMVPRKKPTESRRGDDDFEPPTLRSPAPVFDEDEGYDEDRPTPIYTMSDELERLAQDTRR